MKKLLIPGIAAGAVLIALAFVVAPAQEATAVHTTVQTTIQTTLQTTESQSTSVSLSRVSLSRFRMVGPDSQKSCYADQTTSETALRV